MFIDQLELNHIGVVVAAKMILSELQHQKTASLLKIKSRSQGFFELNTVLQTQFEYIAQEGRVANAALLLTIVVTT